MSAGSAGERGAGSGVPFLALAVPLLSFLLAFLLLLDLLPRGMGGDPLSEERPAATVPGWTGALVLASGERLDVRLTPLHGEPARQAFDAQAWREGLELESGEPFRLGLARDGSAGAGPALDVAAWLVADESGVLLRPVDALVDRAVLPPWGLLLGAGEASLAPGGRLERFLWGPRPGSETELRLRFDEASGSAGIPGSSGLPASSMALTPARVDLHELPRELAALDARRTTE